MRSREIFELKGYRDSEEVSQFKTATNDFQGKMATKDRKAKLKEFANYLKGKGFKSLGSGAFGVTFTHPSFDYCVKVFKNDPAYILFYKWAVTQQKNPHLPKFRGKLMQIDNTYSAVRMEILDEDFSMDDDFAVSIFAKYAIADDREREAIRNHLKAIIANKEEDYDTYESYSVVIDQSRIFQTINDLERVNTGYVLDLHGGNFMRRHDGTIVIIDPFGDDSQYGR